MQACERRCTPLEQYCRVVNASKMRSVPAAGYLVQSSLHEKQNSVNDQELI